MDESNDNLWICPICSAEHLNPVIICLRCEGQILLLNKIKFVAGQLKNKGQLELSRRFYDKEGES